MKKLFLISSTAGASEFYFNKSEIEEVYRINNRLDEIEVFETEYKGHLEEIVNDFLDEPYDGKVIILLGGDGSLNEVINLTYGYDIAIGLIPTGTGNDFAKNFDYKNFKIEDTFDITIRPIDLIKVNNKYCVNVTSLGFDTEVLKTAYDYLDRDKSLGKKAYLLAVRDRIKNLTYQKLTMDLHLVDGSKVRLEDEFLISAICNGSFYGSGFNPAPAARVDDGLLNLVLAYRFPKWKLLPLILKYKNGRHQSSPYLDEFKVISGTLKSDRDFLANNDGEIFVDDKIDFKIIPKSLNWAYFGK